MSFQKEILNFNVVVFFSVLDARSTRKLVECPWYVAGYELDFINSYCTRPHNNVRYVGYRVTMAWFLTGITPYHLDMKYTA